MTFFTAILFLAWISFIYQGEAKPNSKEAIIHQIWKNLEPFQMLRRGEWMGILKLRDGESVIIFSDAIERSPEMNCLAGVILKAGKYPNLERIAGNIILPDGERRVVTLMKDIPPATLKKRARKNINL